MCGFKTFSNNLGRVQSHFSVFPHLNWSSGSRLNPFPPPPPKRSVEFDCDVITDEDELLVAATAANVDAAADAMEEEVRMELAAVDTAAAETGLSEREKKVD